MAQARQRLFFAVRPSATASQAAFSQAQQLQLAHRLTGRLIPIERLHVTLHWLRDHVALSQELVAQAMAAGSGVEMAPFDVVFERVESLGDANHGGPLVLAGSQGLLGLRKLQRALADAMKDAGLGEYVRTGFLPHVTLLYAEQSIAPQSVAPIRWTVTELLLVHSVVGEARHITLGQWPLQSAQLGLGDR
jgi:2'-5' RNA ligase